MTANAKLARVTDTLDGNGATVEPLALADAKAWLNVPPSITDNDSLIADMITSARMQCETINNRSFVTTTWDYTIDLFPGGGYGYLGALASVLPGYSGWGSGDVWGVDLSEGAIQLPMPPLISVISIAYVDFSGNVRSVDPAGSGVVISAGTPGRIAPAYGSFFPFTRPTTGAVVIRYTAGYGADPRLVPANVRRAIRLLVGMDFNQGDDVTETARRVLDATRWGAY